MKFADFVHWLNSFVADACLFNEPDANQLGIIRDKLNQVLPSDAAIARRAVNLSFGADGEPLLGECA